MDCSDLGLNWQYDNVAIVLSEVDSDHNVASSRTSNVAGPVSRNEFESEAEKVADAHLSDEASSTVIKPV